MVAEKTCNLDLEIDGKVIRTITVPFSESEVDTLRGLRDIKTNWWRTEGVRGSGWHRDLYTDLEIPWGATLIDREEAMAEARKSLERIEGLLQKTSQSAELASMENDLRSIASGLLSVFPKKDESVVGKIKSFITRKG